MKSNKFLTASQNVLYFGRAIKHKADTKKK